MLKLGGVALIPEICLINSIATLPHIQSFKPWVECGE